MRETGEGDELERAWGKPLRTCRLLRELTHIHKNPSSSPGLNGPERLLDEIANWGRRPRPRGSELDLTEGRLDLDRLERGRTGTADNP